MKIQILELPMRHVGEYSTTPYAVIFSEVPVEGMVMATDELNHLRKTVEDVSWTLATDLEVEL